MRGASRLNGGNGVGGARHPERREEDCEDHDREEEIGHRSGQHDQEALPHRFQVEASRAQLLGDAVLVGRDAGGILIADELDESAERQPADLPPSTASVGPADDLAAEAEREGLGADPERLADQIMAELMNEDERPDGADERDEDEP